MWTNLTFLESIFSADVVVLTLYFALISIVQALSSGMLVTKEVQSRTRFAAWYMFGIAILTMSVVFIQEYFQNGVDFGSYHLSLSWVYGSEAALFTSILFVIGLILIIRLSLQLMKMITIRVHPKGDNNERNK
jgi:hypothetical protein